MDSAGIGQFIPLILIFVIFYFFLIRPFKDTYKSDVSFDKKNDSIFVKNIEGPLNHLTNNWKY